jgi:hypothetical protein
MSVTSRSNIFAAFVRTRYAPRNLALKQSVRPRPHCRRNMLEQPHQGVHVVFAVFLDCLAFVGAVRRAFDNPAAHILLVRRVDSVLAKILKRTPQAIEPLLAFDTAVVGEMAELDIGVEGVSGLRPAQREVTTEFGRGHIADDQRSTVDSIWRQ